MDWVQRTISLVGGDSERPLLANTHSDETLVPALNYLANADWGLGKILALEAVNK